MEIKKESFLLRPWQEEVLRLLQLKDLAPIWVWDYFGAAGKSLFTRKIIKSLGRPHIKITDFLYKKSSDRSFLYLTREIAEWKDDHNIITIELYQSEGERISYDRMNFLHSIAKGKARIIILANFLPISLMDDKSPSKIIAITHNYTQNDQAKLDWQHVSLAVAHELLAKYQKDD
jgi:hypothetical protein